MWLSVGNPRQSASLCSAVSRPPQRTPGSTRSQRTRPTGVHLTARSPLATATSGGRFGIHRGSQSTPGRTRPCRLATGSILVICRSPRRVHGRPQPSTHAGTSVFRFHRRPPAVHSRPWESTANGSQLGSREWPTSSEITQTRIRSTRHPRG